MTASNMLYQAINRYATNSLHVEAPEYKNGVLVSIDSFRITTVNNNTQITPVAFHQQVIINGKAYNTSTNFSRNLSTIKNMLTGFLHERGIDLPFTLTRVASWQPDKKGEEVAVPEQSKPGSPQIKATFKGIPVYLFQKNLIPLCISAILILLTAGGLWYVLRTLRKQLRIDEMKNSFISNMTHELRTPVAILRSTHEALNQFGYIHDTERALRYLKANQSVLDQLDANIDLILTISNFDSSTMRLPLAPVDLHQLLTQVLQRFSSNDTLQINLQYQLPHDIYVTNANMIATIVSNLVDNAIKYSTTTPQVTVLAAPSSKGWRLEVQDNGIGIDGQHLPYIFDRFYRVSTGNIHNVKGYGLGLNYVKLLTDRAGGHITVKSQPGQGSTFTIAFPLHELH